MADCVLANVPDVFFAEVWQSYKNSFNKTYATGPEETRRFGIFLENYKQVVKNNLQGGSYRQGVNRLLDLTQQEIQRDYLTDFGKPSSSSEGKT